MASEAIWKHLEEHFEKKLVRNRARIEEDSERQHQRAKEDSERQRQRVKEDEDEHDGLKSDILSATLHLHQSIISQSSAASQSSSPPGSCSNQAPISASIVTKADLGHATGLVNKVIDESGSDMEVSKPLGLPHAENFLEESPKLRMAGVGSNHEAHVSADGSNFIAPDSLKGVPICLINKKSPYWSNAWKDFAGVLVAIQTRRNRADNEERTLARELGVLQVNNADNAVIQQKKKERDIAGINKTALDADHRVVLESQETWIRRLRAHPNQIVRKSYIQDTGLIQPRQLQLLQKVIKVFDEAKEFGVLTMQPVVALRLVLDSMISSHVGDDFSVKEALKTIMDQPEIVTLQTQIRELKTERTMKRAARERQRQELAKQAAQKKALEMSLDNQAKTDAERGPRCVTPPAHKVKGYPADSHFR